MQAEKERHGEQLKRDPDDSLDEAVTQILSTLPAMFRTIKQQARGTESSGPWRDLGGSQIWVLHALTRGKQLSGELARGFNVTNPTMTRIVDGLVEKGYVERQHDPVDRRRIYLRITEEGREVERQTHQQFRDAMTAFLRPLSEQQLGEIMLAFQHLQSILPEEGVDHGGSCPVRVNMQASLTTGASHSTKKNGEEE
jgi:DNA-binding MarR family transcriptional regulator